jgi:hypothetical protein
MAKGRVEPHSHSQIQRSPFQSTALISTTGKVARNSHASLSIGVQVALDQATVNQTVLEQKQMAAKMIRKVAKDQLLVKAPTPINVPVLVNWLKAYPVVKGRELLISGFTDGFKLGYKGPRVPRDSVCLPSALQNSKATWAKLEKEMSLGRIVGPFDSRPLSTLQCSPIGLIPKSQPGEWRLITHLSFPPGNSINDGIPDELISVKYASFDQAVGLVQEVGHMAYLAKCDIKSAFRLLPIYPGDFDLLGFKFDGKYFIDKCLPMGASISCSHFECFSSYLEFQVKANARSKFITHYLDDFLFVGDTQVTCQKLLHEFQKMCNELGVPLAPEKTVGPTTSLTYLGLEIDTVNKLVKVPQPKVEALVNQLQKAAKAEFLTLREIQSLIGSLNFVCRAISPGRAFIRRLIGLTIGVTNSRAKVKVGVGAKGDMSMWLTFLRNFNGACMFLETQWTSNLTLELFTDAAMSVGFGCFFQNKWAQGKWPPSLHARSSSILFLEFYPLVVAIDLWGHLMSNKKVRFWSDNKAVVETVNKQTTKCSRTMVLVRRFVLLALKHNVMFRASYIEGKCNRIADALSRFQNPQFRKLAPRADTKMTPLPAWVL